MGGGGSWTIDFVSFSYLGNVCANTTTPALLFRESPSNPLQLHVCPWMVKTYVLAFKLSTSCSTFCWGGYSICMSWIQGNRCDLWTLFYSQIAPITWRTASQDPKTGSPKSLRLGSNTMATKTKSDEQLQQ